MKMFLKQTRPIALMLVIIALLMSSVIAFAASGTFFTTTDNEDNGGSGSADGDMDIDLFNTDPLSPIEFNIDIGAAPLPPTTAYLVIRAWDVDEEAGQLDEVFLNGTSLGYLYGDNNIWTNSVFDVPVGLLQANNNLVRVDIDTQNPGGGHWYVQVDWGQLALDGGRQTNASMTLDACSEVSGSNVIMHVTVVDTATNAGTYDLLTDLVLGDGTSPDNDNRSFTRTAGAVTTTTFDLTYPISNTSGTYQIRSSLYNQADSMVEHLQIFTFTHTQNSDTSAPCAAAEMDVTGNSISITDGDTTPSAADDTDFGSEVVNTTPVCNTFTIENSGTSDLTLSGTPIVDITGTHAGDFTVTTQPTSPVASGGGTTAFEVCFTPSAAGQRDATISIANDDGDENPYNFDIQGTGLPDFDGDGVEDDVDLDDDNDGIPDTVEIANAGGGGDTDGDGYPDHQDLDSDDDGINDVIEAGGTDANGDALADGTDGNGDGMIDTPLNTPPDSDGDGQEDYIDLDSDNDGGSDLSGTGAAAADSNGDGMIDGPDADGDGIKDAVDDNDGKYGEDSDSGNEGNDRDGDGIPNSLDYDPTGYFYDMATGEIIAGGLIQVSGPGAVTIVHDGSSGRYEFNTDGTAGIYNNHHPAARLQ